MIAEKIVDSLQIKERYKMLKKQGAVQRSENRIPDWLNRKSLCTESLFYESLKLRGISEDKFNSGIKPLNAKERQYMFHDMKSFRWFKVFGEIFSVEEIEMEQKEIIDFAYALRFYAKYAYDQISKMQEQKDEASARQVTTHIMDDLINIGIKVFVQDLHDFKNERIVEGESPEKRYHSYLVQRFGSAALCEDFFCDYPVLGRLCVERIILHLDNYRLFLQYINEAEDQLNTVFGICKPYNIQILSMGDGDSHGGGKSVMTFRLNDKKLIFKYKNLEIGNRLNHFFEKLEEYNPRFDFYKVKRIINDKYTIEEFVPHLSCESEEEISQYYYRFGEYTALCYFLCGNDFHYENIIAHGAYPVLIDVETLIQNDTPLMTGKSAYAKVMIEKYGSVLGTGLLPTEFFANRIEPPNTEVKHKGIQMSGLSGEESDLPFKVLKLKNINTDEVRFEYMPHKISDAGNRALLNGEKVKGEDYYEIVMKGFKDIFQFFIDNKEKLVLDIQSIFSNVLVRNVIKSTQKYADMLHYGFHPKCMKNYLEREKLFENIWAFEYISKTPVPHEIEDMLQNDVPIFYNNTSQTSLLNSKHEEIPGFYERTAIDRVTERIGSLNEYEFKEQLKYMTIALELYDGELQTYTELSDPDKIVNHIINTAIYGDEETVTWKDLCYQEKWDYNNLPINFYNGAAGLYIFLLHYNKYYEKKEVTKILNYMDKTVFMPVKGVKSAPSVYTDVFSSLYPLAQKIRLYQKPSDIKYAMDAVKAIGAYYQENNGERNDWIDGKAGLVKVLLLLHDITKENIFLETAQKVADKIIIADTNLCGLAHGYSGIMIALVELYRKAQDQKYIKLIEQCLTMENANFNGEHWADNRENKNTINHWCHGTTGIGLARLKLIKHDLFTRRAINDLKKCVEHVLQAEPQGDCLCHGKAGNLYFLETAMQCDQISETVKEQMRKRIDEIYGNMKIGLYLEGFEQQPSLGFMQGLTGIGYYMLSRKETGIPNALLLD